VLPPRVTSLRETGYRSPSQWEGCLDDGRPVYIRYRHGSLSVQFGPIGGDIDSAVLADPWFEERLNIDDDPGSTSIERVAEITGLVIDCPVEGG